MKLHPLSPTRPAYVAVGHAEFDLPGNSAKSAKRGFKSRIILAVAVNTAMEARTQPETRLLRLAEVVELTTLSKSLIYSMMRDGAFPRNVILSENRVAWKRDSVFQWLATRSVSRSSLGGDE